MHDSLVRKISNFQSLVYALSPSIVAVTETWLSEAIFDNELLPKGYTIFRKDRASRGGGVLLAAANYLPITLLPSPSDLEILWVQLGTPHPFHICVVYAPPSSNDSYWLSLLAFIRTVFSTGCPTFLVGDLNCPDIVWSTLSGSCSTSSMLCDLLFDLQLVQAVEEPTHTKGNTLDLIISNSEVSLSDVKVHQNHLFPSDHFLITFSINTAISRPHHNSSTTFFDYSKADLDSMCHFLLDWDFSPCFHSQDVETIWVLIKSAVSTAITKFVPTVSCSRRNSNLPKWFDKDLRHNLNCLRSLRRRCKSLLHPTSHLSEKLFTAESGMMESIISAKADYEAKLVDDFAHNNNARIFSHINSMTKQDQLPLKMYHESSKYFFSVYSSLPGSISCSSISPVISDSIGQVDITSSDVYKALSCLDIKKAMGIDGIGPNILKHCACALFQPIHHLFKVSLLTAQLPSEWRIHRITPIYKSGDKSLVSNYRPISLLCSVSKVLERLIYDRIIDYLSLSLSPLQFGFLRGKSTLQQLLVFLHNIHNNLSNKAQLMLSILTSGRRSTVSLMIDSLLNSILWVYMVVSCDGFKLI